MVDKDDSGEIDFEEFLKVMQPKPAKLPPVSTNGGGGFPAVGGEKKRKKKKKKKEEQEQVEEKNGGSKPQASSSSPPVDDNPIAQLQQIQKRSGDMDMDVVVAIQRRNFLMNAVVGEMRRREHSLSSIGDMEAEAKTLRGEGKHKMLAEIKEKQRVMEKEFNRKQTFVQSMKVMIGKSKEAAAAAKKPKARASRKESDNRTMTLTEAIDQFAFDFDLGTLKENKKARSEPRGAGLAASPFGGPRLRGITSRQGSGSEPCLEAGVGDGERSAVGAGATWYERSGLKMKEGGEGGRGEEGGKGGGGERRRKLGSEANKRGTRGGRKGGTLSHKEDN